MRSSVLCFPLILLISCTKIVRQDVHDADAVTDDGLHTSTDVPALMDAPEVVEMDQVPPVDSPTAADVMDVQDSSALPDAPVVPVTIPDQIRAEVVFDFADNPTPRQSSNFNPNLPKITGDENYYYASVSYLNNAASGGWGRIYRRGRRGGPWMSGVQVDNIMQPLGIAMDSQHILHAVMDCPANGPGTQNCLGNSITSDNVPLRFHHLAFAERALDRSIDFSLFRTVPLHALNSNSYPSLHIFGDVAAVSVLTESPRRRIASIGNSAPFQFVSDTTAFQYLVAVRHPMAAIFLGSDITLTPPPTTVSLTARAVLGAVVSTIHTVSPDPVPPGGAVANASDIQLSPRGELFALTRVHRNNGMCTELIRAMNPVRVETLPVGCVESYAKLQVVDDNTLVIFTAGAFRSSLRIGVSLDRGASWDWVDRTIDTGPDPLQIVQITTLHEQSGPLAFERNRAKLLFCTQNGANPCTKVFFTEFALR